MQTHRTGLMPVLGSDTLPGSYDREPTFSGMVKEKDVAVSMRDGVHLSVNVYRPNEEARFPALLAFAIYNKDLQGPDYAASLPPQPAWAPLWAGLLEAGDTKFFVSRGYVHVGGFRDEHPGGVLHLFRYLISHFSAIHQNKGAPGELPAERDKLWRAA